MTLREEGGRRPSESAMTGGEGAPEIEIRGLRFSYDPQTPVLADVNLDVRVGACTCLMGPNGCGKSTLLDCVLGVHRPEAGQVLLRGKPVCEMRPAQLARLLSYVPQVHERSFPYTVEHIVLMGRTALSSGLGAPGSDDAEAAREALETCGIGHLASRPYTGISGGEMQMVMLARALAQDAPVILMDEPTAHLDFRNELLFLETVERLVRDRGVTVLMATHAPNQAFHLEAAGVPCEVALMGAGKVVAFGTPGEVLDERALREVFGVSACLLEGWAGGRPVRQIAPLRTVRCKEGNGKGCDEVSA